MTIMMVMKVMKMIAKSARIKGELQVMSEDAWSRNQVILSLILAPLLTSCMASDSPLSSRGRVLHL